MSFKDYYGLFRVVCEEIRLSDPNSLDIATMERQQESMWVARLKALYGLKQSLRAWFGKFSDATQWFGMHRCQFDHSIFSCMTEEGARLC